MIVAFYKAPGDWMDKLIRLTTRSIYSHCELLIEAPDPARATRAISSSGRDGGVREDLIQFYSDRWDIIEIEWAPHDAAAMARIHLGADYDLYGAVCSQFPILRREQDSRWFCSELIAWSLGLSQPETLSPGALALRLVDLNRAYKLGLSAK
jgi:hypothetical protein